MMIDAELIRSLLLTPPLKECNAVLDRDFQASTFRSLLQASRWSRSGLEGKPASESQQLDAVSACRDVNTGLFWPGAENKTSKNFSPIVRITQSGRELKRSKTS